MNETITSSSFRASLLDGFEKRKALVLASKGRIAIFAHGVGEWTITFGKQMSVEERADLDADLVCVWGAEGFQKLLSGEPEAPVSAIGDSALLKKLGRLLSPKGKRARASKPQPAFAL